MVFNLPRGPHCAAHHASVLSQRGDLEKSMHLLEEPRGQPRVAWWGFPPLFCGR